MQEVKDDIAKTEIELMDEVDMELTNDERTAHKEAWHKHCKSSMSLKKSREKVYFLLLVGGLVKGFPPKNAQTKITTGPKNELCGGGQQKTCPRITDDHHFWQRRVKRWG